MKNSRSVEWIFKFDEEDSSPFIKENPFSWQEDHQFSFWAYDKFSLTSEQIPSNRFLSLCWDNKAESLAPMNTDEKPEKVYLPNSQKKAEDVNEVLKERADSEHSLEDKETGDHLVEGHQISKPKDFSWGLIHNTSNSDKTPEGIKEDFSMLFSGRLRFSKKLDKCKLFYNILRISIFSKFFIYCRII